MRHSFLRYLYRLNNITLVQNLRNYHLRLPLSLARQELPLMKRTFTDMEEASPSAASAGPPLEAEPPAAAESTSAFGEMVPANTVAATSITDEPLVSKNKLKKLKRDREWEEKREQRKVWRKIKLQEKKQRKRAAREQAAVVTGTAVDASVDESLQKHDPENTNSSKYRQAVQVPITLLIDCGFDEMMVDVERKSLASQLTRCYSDNNKAPYQAHLAISSFGGHLKERFDTVLSGQYKSWKGVRFFEDDVPEAARKMREWMEESKGDRITGALAAKEKSLQTPSRDLSDDEEIVYLTSDSPDTLTELWPYRTYVIGGIVDKNRHKGICYKKAMDQNIKTAKLPIGDYIQMASRSVLTTNQVAEIMLRWLELGDWGEAFDKVIPKRKGGVLKEKIIERDARTEVTLTNAGDLNEAAAQSIPPCTIEVGSPQKEHTRVDSTQEKMTSEL